MNSLFVKITSPGKPSVSLSGWTGARITRSIEDCTGSFELQMSERYPDEIDETTLIAGAAVEISIDESNVLLTGYVDTVEYTITPHEHWLVVTGRGKCQDLIDCSTNVDRVLANTRLDALCQSVVKQFGIGVTVTNALEDALDTLPTIPFQLIAITETPWEVIERCCRYTGALAFELEDGSLGLALAGDSQGPSGVQLGANIESAISIKSSVGRFSTVSAVLSNYNNAIDVGVNLLPQYTGTDPGVNRVRPKFIVSEQPASDRTYLQRRVDWQIARAYGQSRKLSLLVDSWLDSSGAPWTLNTQIPVSLPLLKVPDNTLLLLVQISFLLDRNGTHAELVLAPRQGYLPEPLVLVLLPPDIAP